MARVPIFARLSADAQLEVAGFARPRSLARGEVLHHQGDAVAHLFVVHEGTAKLTHARADGQERLLRTVGPGGVVGEDAFLTGARPDHTVTAVEPLRVCVFDHRDVARLIAQHPAIALAMLQDLSRRLGDAERHVAVLSWTDVPARLADYLLALPARRRAGQYVVELPMAKREVASYLGTTPESLSRALRRMSGAGTVAVDGRDVTLIDLDALESLAN